MNFQSAVNMILIFIFSAFSLFMLIYGNKQEEKEAEKKEKAKKSFSFDKAYKYLVIAVFVIGILVRFVNFWEMPRGLNQDEASVAYDTWADLNYGIDRNGDHNPVYSVAWGSGHSSLYITVSKPFIKLLGLNMFSARFANVLFSCLALFAFWGILKRLFGKYEALLGTFLFAIMPWHIMMGRWALECNIFPNIFLIATYFLVLGFSKPRFYILSLFCYALSLYAYGTAYMFVPVFLLIMAVYIIKHKKINVKIAIISAAVFLVTALPIMLFMAVNMLGFPELDFGFLSVPKLISGRYNTTVTVLSGNFFESVASNLKVFSKIFFTQNDGLPWNAVKPYGTIFMFSAPFCIAGIVKYVYSVYKQSKAGFTENFIFAAMIVSSLVLMTMSELNINRANVIFVPITFFTFYGLLYTVKSFKALLVPVILVYFIAFLSFTGFYFTKYQDEIGVQFSYGFEEAILYADENASGNVYMTKTINAPYIKAMFYLKTDPNSFLDTVNYRNPDSQVRWVDSFERYYTGIPDAIDETADNAYIFQNGEYLQRTDFDKDKFTATVFGNYTVCVLK